ncbi:starch synthase [Jatrophihabitans sp. GAS493]|uniref:glycogen synthase n=1 Tax=Jatrophihabitans sp. GAS493 TaxID=1907575 RepID=UPI000BB6D91C|nr:glycogen synthase [Jatrophihabitans sp. GAS493]SOD75103.1 starch synthase [Jatrophihabitans sp. GAS493]
MRVGILTKEYPPEVYGGAGVHVEFLVSELRKLIDVDVHCFGAERGEPGVRAYATPGGLASANAALQTLGVDLEIAANVAGADLLHSHTWYANLAGVLGGQLNGVPHVLSAHSLEPQRPWKAEQLGGGYRISSWAERQAYESAAAIIAVSSGMRNEILSSYPFVDPARVHVIYNGIDTGLYRPRTETDVLEEFGVDPQRPSAIFVGRITRQKGLVHLLAAARDFDPSVQLILCAGAPDTDEIAAETKALVDELQRTRTGVIWIRDMLPRPQVVQLLTHATVFVCPSIYEPLGIVNLEAMACSTAVVASDVGGIPEVVNDGETGTLVHYDVEAPAEFEAGIAAAVNAVVADTARAEAFGAAGRQRAVGKFGWAAIAAETVELYRDLLG